MAKKTVLNELARVITLGAIKVKDNKFYNLDGTPMKICSKELYNNYLEKGDEITIPKDYCVYSIKDGNSLTSFIFVTIKSLDGSEYLREFYPNCLMLQITPIDENGHRLPKVKAGGTVATWYADQGTVDNAMMQLAGKTIVVKDIKYYTIKDQATAEKRYAAIPVYEWKQDVLVKETVRSTKCSVSAISNIPTKSVVTQITKMKSSNHSQKANYKYACDIDINDIRTHFKHYSIHSMPFQESIVDVKCPKEIDYSNRKEWLSNLYLITESGYYIQCKDICKTVNFSSFFDERDDQPYEVFLDGILRMAWVYAYNADHNQTLSFIKNILEKGKLTVTRDDRNLYHFLFSAYGYSWI